MIMEDDRSAADEDVAPEPQVEPEEVHAPVPVDIVASEDAQVSFPASQPQKGITMPEVDGNAEFPVPCKRFLGLLVDTDDEVWTHWLNRVHGRENHKVKEWRSILESHKAGAR